MNRFISSFIMHINYLSGYGGGRGGCDNRGGGAVNWSRGNKMTIIRYLHNDDILNEIQINFKLETRTVFLY